MKVKTSELRRRALDWAVAKCEGRREPELLNNFATAWFTWGNVHYSTNWAQAGPIIEREFICVSAPMHPSTAPWCAISDSTGCKSSGPTPLVAAMRCYVASKLGDEVEVPDEIVS
jgi:hypothetical protein